MKEKKNKKSLAGMLIVLTCILFGCAKEEGLVLASAENTSEESAIRQKEEDAFIEAGVYDENSTVQTQAGKEEAEPQTIFVHICGAVAVPGVYELEEGARIFHVLECAGGFLEEAAEDYLNQAQLLTDGMQLYIPTKEEVERAGLQGTIPGTDGMPKETGQSSENAGLVNINTAGKEKLCTLPGIGSEKAEAIIAYREKNGAFSRLEDIMKVSGIKEGMFAKIKDKICVS